MFVLYARNFKHDPFHFIQKYLDNDFTDLSALRYDLIILKKLDPNDPETHNFFVSVVQALVNDNVYRDEDIILEHLEN